MAMEGGLLIGDACDHGSATDRAEMPGQCLVLHQAALAQRPTGFTHVPAALWDTMTSYFGTPVLVGGGLGLSLDLWLRRLPRLILVVTILTVAGVSGDPSKPAKGSDPPTGATVPTGSAVTILTH